MPEPDPNIALPEPLTRRFQLVTGKGGVGKSTVCALIAQRSAQAGRRTLICELNTQPRMPALFGQAPVANELSELADNLWCVNIVPAEAMEEYGVMKLRFRALYRLVFDNPLVQRLINFIPGMNDLMMLGKAFNHEREVNDDGSPTWDTIIIDAPATGHGLTFFGLPRIIRDAVPAGNLHREADLMWTLMTDSARTAVHLVTLPEELPVRETQELHHRLAHLKMPMGLLFLNMTPSQLLPPAEGALFDQLKERPADPALAQLWATTRIHRTREALAARYRAELEGLKMPIISLAALHTTQFGPAEVRQLAAMIPGALPDEVQS